MVDQTKRDALRWGIIAGLGVTAGTQTFVAKAQSIDRPSVEDTIELLSHPIGVELLIMRARMLLAMLAHVALTRSPDGLLEELRQANEITTRGRDPFRLLYALRVDRARDVALARLRRFSGTPRAQWVSDQLQHLRSSIVATVAETEELSVETPMVTEAIRTLDHVEYIFQSGRDLNSTEVQALSWCDYPLIRCFPPCEHRCSWW